MSEGNLISWAGTQPIWIQVFIGLGLFFVGLPLVIFAISELFSAFGDFLSSLIKSLSKEAKTQSRQTTSEQDELSDDILLQALCKIHDGRKTEEEIKDFLSYKSSAERSALKKNHQVLQAIGKRNNELFSQSEGQNS